MNESNATRRRSETGFSLIEMLIAFALLAISATSLFLLASATSGGNVKSKDQAAAAALAVDKLETLKNTPYTEIVAGSDSGTLSAAGTSGGTFTRSWTVSATTLAGVPGKNVTVTVSGTPDLTVAMSTTVLAPPSLAPGYLEGFPAVVVRSWSQQ